MKANKAVTKEYVITLTKEERDWLREMVQNPIHCDNPNDEDPLERDMRQTFWDALQ